MKSEIIEEAEEFVETKAAFNLVRLAQMLFQVLNLRKPQLHNLNLIQHYRWYLEFCEHPNPDESEDI